MRIPLQNTLPIASVKSTQHFLKMVEHRRYLNERDIKMYNLKKKCEEKKVNFFYRWTLGIDRALQNKEMREIRLNKHQKLHSRNRFQDFFSHLKAPSLGALIFRKV
jgi:hypothetical protein